MRFVTTCVLMLLWLSGCSMTQIDINNAVDWTSIETVSLPSLSADNYKLLNVLEQELQATGFDPVHPEDGTSDAVLSLNLDQVLDLTETGATRQRTKAVHLQITHQTNSTILAQGRYELASTQSPEQGIHRIFQKLRKTISHSQIVADFRHSDNSSGLTTAPKRTEIPTNNEPQQHESDSSPGHIEPTLEKDNSPSDWLPKFHGWDLSPDDEAIR